jgi:hypothetical protein
MQVNLLTFMLVCLVLFGSNSRAGCILRLRVARRSRRRRRLGHAAAAMADSGDLNAVHGDREFPRQRHCPGLSVLREGGRPLPEGLEYVDNWVEANFSRCFQLMRCDDLRLIQAWILEWRNCGVTFEIVPVVTSAETRAVVEPYLEWAVNRPEQPAAG